MVLFRQVVSATLIVTAMSQLTGCHMRLDVPMQPTPEAFASRHPGAVRVTRADGSRLHLYEPQLIGDTLRGLDREPPSIFHSGFLQGRPRELSVPLKDIRAIEARSTDVPLSVLVNVAIGVGMIWVLVTAWNNNSAF